MRGLKSEQSWCYPCLIQSSGHLSCEKVCRCKLHAIRACKSLVLFWQAIGVNSASFRCQFGKLLVRLWPQKRAQLENEGKQRVRRLLNYELCLTPKTS